MDYLQCIWIREKTPLLTSTFTKWFNFIHLQVYSFSVCAVKQFITIFLNSLGHQNSLGILIRKGYERLLLNAECREIYLYVYVYICKYNFFISEAQVTCQFHYKNQRNVLNF